MRQRTAYPPAPALARTPVFLSPVLPLALALALITAGCASFQPGRVEDAAFLQRASHREDGRFRVEVAVPSPAEARHLFDRRLDRLGIQPVWVRVENRSAMPVFFLPHVMDDDYYAPLEVAYQYHSAWQPQRNTGMDLFFLSNAMPARIPAGGVRSGFVFTHLDLGHKQVCVGLSDGAAIRPDLRYAFVVPVPGLQADAQQKLWLDMTNGMQFLECDDARLRAELEKMPRATTDKSGRKEGDPLNLVIIGDRDDLTAMIGCGWNRTERVTSGTAWRTFKSFLFGGDYRYSPVSPLYYAGRPQDFALQKARGSVTLRNHLRLWLTPLTHHGKPVWLGQISRDIGVRWTLQTPTLTTHKINPNVDEARSYLIQNLVLGQAASWSGYVTGVGAASLQSPRHNLTGDPYFTDGLRAVILLSTEPVRTEEFRWKTWEVPPEKSFGP